MTMYFLCVSKKESNQTSNERNLPFFQKVRAQNN